jgi:putative transposase
MKDKFGLNQTLEIVGLPKSTWYYYQKQKIDMEQKYQSVKDDLYKVAREHPAYGYKRATPELKEVYGHQINKKVVIKLMRDQEIQILRKVKKPKPNQVNQILTQLGNKMNLVAINYLIPGNEIGLFEVYYTDFTQVEYAQGRKKAQLMPIIEHQAKVAVGWAIGKTANTQVALAAWEKVRQTTKQLKFKLKGIIVHHDRDPVYTGYEWLGQLLLIDQCQISYALRGAKDNPEMESFNSHFKGENQTLFWECETLAELIRVVDEQMKYYNQHRRHSSIGNQAPLTYLKQKRNRRQI